LALLASTLALSAASATAVASTAAAETRSSPTLTAPLSGGTVTADGTWAVAAMGKLDDPVETFWQLFFRAQGSGKWTLVTPKGVADNGGLSATSTGAGTALTVGFQPSNLLKFSPLASTTDGGTQWSPGIVPAGLMTVPDALAGQGASPLLALVRRSGGQVLSGTSTGSSWSVLTSRSALRTTGAGTGACTVTALSAIAVTPSGMPLVGTSCSTGTRVGMFARVGSQWRVIGPTVPGRLAHARTNVLRLTRTGTTVSALVSASNSSGGNLVAMWQRGSSWASSPALHLARTASVRSTAVGASGDITVLVRGAGAGPNSRTTLWQATGAGHLFTRLPTPPAGTSTVTQSADGVMDGMVVHGAGLTVYELAPGASSWQQTQTMIVPIAYGSSG
jgi:hypothetical protein